MRKVFSKEPNFYQKLMWVLLAVAAVLLVLYFDKVWGVVSKIFSYFTPVIVGIAIAFVLNPLVQIYKKGLVKLYRKKFPKHADTLGRNTAVILALLTVCCFLAVILFIAIPEIGDAFDILSTTVPPMIQDLLYTKKM